MWGILMLLLFIFSYADMKEKALPLRWLAVCIVLSGIIAVNTGEGQLWERVIKVLAGMLPGIVMTLTAFLLQGKMGSGDGAVLILICNLVGWKNGVFILTMAAVCSLFYSLLLLLIWKKSKQYCFPFVPFYFLAGIIVWLAAEGC